MEPRAAFVIVTSSGSVVVVVRNAGHSAWANATAYCEGDAVYRSDPSGLDWAYQGNEWKVVEGTD